MPRRYTSELIPPFGIATCELNALTATIHDRMLRRIGASGLWHGPEPAPRDLMKPFPFDLMVVWPIGRLAEEQHSRHHRRDRSWLTDLLQVCMPSLAVRCHDT